MGKDLYEHFPQAKEVFDKAGAILKFDLKKLCFEGPQEELSTTNNSQPAILTASIAALRAFEASPLYGQYTPKFSLGLVWASIRRLWPRAALHLKTHSPRPQTRRIYGRRLEKKSRKMACVMGMEMKTVEDLCKGFGCEIANLNCPGQVIVSGKTNNIELFASFAKDKGAKRVLMLDVSGRSTRRL